MLHQPVPIDFCITGLEAGGAERALVDLVTHLSPQRFAPRVISLAPKPPPAEAILTVQLQTAGIPVEFLNARRTWQAPFVVARLARRLRQRRPRLLQTFLFHANTIGALAGRIAGVPHVVTGIRVAEHRRNLHRWIALHTAYCAERHVCVSHAVARFSHDAAGLPADRLVVIPTGIDVQLYPGPRGASQQNLGIADRRRLLLYAGRFTAQKRVDWLLQQAPYFLAQLPEHDLCLVGRGELETRLRRLAEQLGIAPRVVFAGWQRDLRPYLAACDLVVLTSQWEGLPRILMEAMASGKPVVATAAEGVAELLGCSHGGQLVQNGDAQALIRAVVAIAGDPTWAAQLGAENRRRIETEYRLERAVKAYEALYEQLLAGDDMPCVSHTRSP